MVHELNLDNIYMQFYVFGYLLWNGYFSINKKYFYNDKAMLNEKNTIFLGKGCCRHNAKLLQEVYSGLNIYCKKNRTKK